MNLEIREEPMGSLADYAEIPISFEVRRILDVAVEGSTFVLTERTLEVPYVKDYDTSEGARPARWGERFDVSTWGLISARFSRRLVGGAVIAFDTPEITMLENRSDLAVLWDIRVRPDVRGCGVGSALFRTPKSGPPPEGAVR